MEDIGKRLRVSKVTVSKALNHKEGVGDELRAEILRVAKELKYQGPGASKGEQKTRYIITVIVRERYFNGEAKQPSYYMDIYQKLTSELSIRGYLCNLITIKDDIDSTFSLKELIEKFQSDGIIILGPLDENHIKLIKKYKTPILFLDSYKSEDENNVVIVDNYYSAYKLTQYSIKKGRKKIGFVGTIDATDSILDRYMGYTRALRKAGISLNEEWIIEDRGSHGEDITMHLPESMPEVFICNCGETAYKLVDLLKAKGIKIPEEVSILGFDDDVYAKFCMPQLTVIAVDLDIMVKKAVDLLYQDILGGTDDPSSRIMIHGHIIERDSFLLQGSSEGE